MTINVNEKIRKYENGNFLGIKVNNKLMKPIIKAIVYPDSYIRNKISIEINNLINLFTLEKKLNKRIKIGRR